MEFQSQAFLFPSVTDAESLAVGLVEVHSTEMKK